MHPEIPTSPAPAHAAFAAAFGGGTPPRLLDPDVTGLLSLFCFLLLPVRALLLRLQLACSWLAEVAARGAVLVTVIG